MRRILKDHKFFRWLIPTTLTLVVLALLGHKSSVPQLFSRYSCTFFLLLLAMGIWTLISWRIALDGAYYRRLSKRIRQVFPFNLAILAIGTLVVLGFFLDYSITRVVRLTPVSPLVPVIPIALMIVMWLLSVDNPRESCNKLSLLVISALIGLYISEGFFQLVLLEHKVPNTEREFVKRVASSWPRPIPVQKGPNTYRILGLSDSFGRAGGSENYHYLLEALL